MDDRAPRWIVVWTSAIGLAAAQSAETVTRAEQIQDQQRAKASSTAPDTPGKAERTFIRAEKFIDRLFGGTAGFRPLIGNMVTGGGFASGIEYLQPDLAKGNLLFRTSARVSIRGYEFLDAQVAMPQLAGGSAFFDVHGVYRNYPTLNYYGPGPRSAKRDRSDYRLEDGSVDVTAGIRPRRHLRLGMAAGYLRVNIGTGTDDRFASIDQVFTPAQVAGLDDQSNFVRVGPFLQYDYRDRRGDPHSGGNYEASYTYYNDVALDSGNHQRLNAEAQQYFPFLNEKRVIALRARTELTYRNSDQRVPFYLQPILGGSEDLRGFRPFRFYDDNLLAMTAEYRWEVMSGFDMAVFTDAGKVFHRHAQLNFADLETSAGFGLRFKSRDGVVMRWDVGFSREGFQVWIKFHNVF